LERLVRGHVAPHADLYHLPHAIRGVSAHAAHGMFRRKDILLKQLKLSL
jgi:hypothetical protein